MNLQTLSSFALARMLNDAAEGSAFQRAIQKEIRTREEQRKDTMTRWLFNEEEMNKEKCSRRPVGDVRASHRDAAPCAKSYDTVTSNGKSGARAGPGATGARAY